MLAKNSEGLAEANKIVDNFGKRLPKKNLHVFAFISFGQSVRFYKDSTIASQKSFVQLRLWFILPLAYDVRNVIIAKRFTQTHICMTLCVSATAKIKSTNIKS